MQGDELREIRNRLGLTQAEMADALGLSPAFIGMMERGEKPIERRTALSVLYLGENPHALRGRHPQFIVYRDKQGLWRWRFMAANGAIIAVSSEAYSSKSNAVLGISLVKASSGAEVLEL